jgi:hypothetical protein
MTRRWFGLLGIAGLLIGGEARAEKVTAAPGKGLTVTADDGKFASTFRARVQMRETFTHDVATDTQTNEISIKTLRLYTYGHVFDKDLRYYLQLAFGPGDFDRDNASPIFDAFVEHVGVRDLNVRIGQFFVPFDRARTIRELALELVDRQQVVRELTLDRDVGVMLSSTSFLGTRNVLAYNLFVGGGEGRNRVGGQVPGPLLVARVTTRPFGSFDDDHDGDLSREKRPRLALGIATAYNHRTNRVNSTYGAALTLGNASYVHSAVDLVFKYAGLSILAEAVRRRSSRQDFFDGTVDGAPAREWTRSGYGYFVQVGMMLSAKTQIVGRWEDLFADRPTDPRFETLAANLGRQIGGGFNVYLNGHFFKIQTDYFHGFGREGNQAFHAARLQLDATF